MDEAIRVKKKWVNINRAFMLMFFMYFVLGLAVAILYPESTDSEELFFPLVGLLIFYIWYALANHIACKKDGHKFILFYFISLMTGIISSFVTLPQMLFEEFSSVFVKGVTAWGCFLALQSLFLIMIPFVLQILLAQASFQLYKINRAKKKLKLAAET